MHQHALDFVNQLIANATAEDLDHEGPWVVVSYDPDPDVSIGSTTILGPFSSLPAAMTFASVHEEQLNRDAESDEVPFVCYPLPLRSPS